ncbi:endopeptidase [Moellerella wisconsensis ATCC 35017]|uniref:Endopeptidase n=1 Tax=Moellerella wisconsensis ATCC 35017 TaxID=1354267 RepID=A0A0N0Z8A6_9GAMM|nr:endopeptidase [Moellerella wisconsensis ATCC 35017]
MHSGIIGGDVKWKITALTLVDVIILEGLLNWQVSENQKLLDENTELKKEKKSLYDALSEQIAITADYEKRINSLHELDTKHTQELTNAKTEIDQLRIAAERNSERIYIKASCLKSEANSTASLDDGTTARPTDSAIRNYWLLRQRIAETEQMIRGLKYSVIHIRNAKKAYLMLELHKQLPLPVCHRIIE